MMFIAWWVGGLLALGLLWTLACYGVDWWHARATKQKALHWAFESQKRRDEAERAAR